MLDLFEIFESLSLPLIQKPLLHLTALPIIFFEDYHLGKDYQGRPFLLIPCNYDTSIRKLLPIVLKNISITYSSNCNITNRLGNTNSGSFLIFTCISSEKNLYRHFLRVMGVIVNALGKSPNDNEIAKVLEIVIDIFKATYIPPKKSVQGLWAELFVISQSVSPIVLLDAWHKYPYDIYDFNIDDERVEIKSTSSDIRQHHFSLKQLTPLDSEKVIVISIFAISDEFGVNIQELYNMIVNNTNLKGKSLLNFELMISKTIGNDWRKLNTERYSLERALTTLEYYNIIDIPRIEMISVSNAISDVHFKVNLTEVPPIRNNYFSNKGILFQSLSINKKIKS